MTNTNERGVSDAMVDALLAVWDDPHNQWHPRAERVRAGLAAALPALCAEVEALRKDAERYRWLHSGPERLCDQPCVYLFKPTDNHYPSPIGGDELDAVIDAARSRNEHEG